MRFTGAAVIFIVGAAFVLVAFGPYLSTACGPKDEQKAASKPTKEAEPSAARGCEKEISDKAIHDALAKPIDLEFSDTPLKEVAKVIAEKAKINVLLATKKLEDAAIDLDTPVTTSLRGISLRSALKLLLSDLGLTYVIRDECLLISTPEDASSQLVICIYDCREILAMRNPVTEDVRELVAPTTTTPPKPSPKPASLGDDLTIPESPPGQVSSSRRTGKDRVEKLLELIVSNVRTDSWDNVGGPGSIQEYEGLFVISTTPEVHEQVEHLLNLLHCAGGLKQPKIKVYE